MKGPKAGVKDLDASRIWNILAKDNEVYKPRFLKRTKKNTSQKEKAHSATEYSTLQISLQNLQQKWYHPQRLANKSNQKYKILLW